MAQDHSLRILSGLLMKQAYSDYKYIILCKICLSCYRREGRNRRRGDGKAHSAEAVGSALLGYFLMNQKTIQFNQTDCIHPIRNRNFLFHPLIQCHQHLLYKYCNQRDGSTDICSFSSFQLYSPLYSSKHSQHTQCIFLVVTYPS